MKPRRASARSTPKEWSLTSGRSGCEEVVDSFFVPLQPTNIASVAMVMINGVGFMRSPARLPPWSRLSPETTIQKVRKAPPATSVHHIVRASSRAPCSCSKLSNIAIRPIGPQVTANLFNLLAAPPQFAQPSSTSTVRRGGLSTASLSTSTTNSDARQVRLLSSCKLRLRRASPTVGLYSGHRALLGLRRLYAIGAKIYSYRGDRGWPVNYRSESGRSTTSVHRVVVPCCCSMMSDNPLIEFRVVKEAVETLSIQITRSEVITTSYKKSRDVLDCIKDIFCCQSHPIVTNLVL